MKIKTVSITPVPVQAEEVSLDALVAQLKELDNQKDTFIKKYYADLDATLKAIVEKQGVNVADEKLYVQLEEGDDVFEISKFKGKFNVAPNYDYKRTARLGEDSQNKLAKKTAEGLGFVLGGVKKCSICGAKDVPLFTNESGKLECDRCDAERPE